MTIKNIRGWFAMFTITLLIVFAFTACSEDDDPNIVDPPEPTDITVLPSGPLWVGQTGDYEIAIEWDESPSKDSSWFAGYEITVSTGAAGTTNTYTVGKEDNSFLATDLPLATTFTFTVRALGNSVLANGIVRSSSQTIQWALATHYDATPIRLYTRETSGTVGGSGLQIHGFAGTPRDRTTAQGADWELALGSNDNLIIGSATAVVTAIGYNLTGTPAHNASITGLVNFDTDVINNMLLNSDLSARSYSNTTINLLTDPIAQAATKGVVFFARINNHYAKIVVKKNGNAGGGFLHSSGNTHYVELYVSYQTRQNVPFAKPNL